MQEELKKAGIKNPNLVMVEGPCLPTRPGALTMSDQADNWVRLSLLLIIGNLLADKDTPPGAGKETRS